MIKNWIYFFNKSIDLAWATFCSYLNHTMPENSKNSAQAILQICYSGNLLIIFVFFLFAIIKFLFRSFIQVSEKVISDFKLEYFLMCVHGWSKFFLLSFFSFNLNNFYPINQGLGSIIGGYLISCYGTRITFAVYAFASLIAIFIFVFVMNVYKKKLAPTVVLGTVNFFSINVIIEILK